MSRPPIGPHNTTGPINTQTVTANGLILIIGPPRKDDRTTITQAWDSLPMRRTTFDSGTRNDAPSFGVQHGPAPVAGPELCIQTLNKVRQRHAEARPSRWTLMRRGFGPPACWRRPHPSPGGTFRSLSTR